MGVLMKQGVNYSGGTVKVEPIIYSEDEREVGVWIDGKPLYQKVWVFSNKVSLDSNVWASVPILISDYNFDTIVNTVANVNDTKTLYNYISVAVDIGDYVRVLSARPSGIQINELMLQYTKTTDTAGSGLWSTTGAPAHHYSQNEQIVGTWIDGKPVYEKIIQWHGVGGSGTITTKELGAPAESIVSLNVLCTYPAGTNNTYYFDGPWWATGNKPIVRYCMHNDNSMWYVQVDVTESGAQDCDFTAIVRYTKTTD